MNWGVRWPIRRITFAIERERLDTSGVRLRCSFSPKTGTIPDTTKLAHARSLSRPELTCENKKLQRVINVFDMSLSTKPASLT